MNHRRKVPKDAGPAIFKAKLEGQSYKDLGEEYGVTAGTIKGYCDKEERILRYRLGRGKPYVIELTPEQLDYLEQKWRNGA